jgi:uncharacterized protein (TIRG00374 family)
VSGHRRVRSKLIFIVNLILGLAILAYVLIAYGDEALAILGANPNGMFGFGVVVSAFATILVLSWRWGFVMGGRHSPIGLMRLTLFRSAAHTLAVLVPSGKLGGDPLRAWLAVRSGVPAGRAIGGVAVDRTLEIGSSAPFSILFAVILLQYGVPQLEQALVTVVIGTVALGVGVAIAVRRLRQGRGLVASLARSSRLSRLSAIDSRMDIAEAADEATADLVGRPRRMVFAFAAGLVANVLVIVEFATLFWAFGLPSDPTAIVAAIFATGAAHMLPIPAGVGVLEGAQIWIFQMLGYSMDVGLAVGLAVRLRELLWMAPGVGFLLLSSLRSSLAQMRDD